MEPTLPFVTTMIVVRNEETYIKPAILSLLNQEYPKDRMELLIIDGTSTDRTMEVARQTVEEYAAGHEAIETRYLDNPKKILAAGWNIGIREAKGNYVVRIDAHAQADPYLVAKGVNILLKNPDVACAGGRIEAQPLTEKGKTISNVLSSPFGVGNARFRYAVDSGYVDTVAYGVYRKSIFEEAGYFNETFMRNQDNDMHGRIKKCGGKFYLDTSITSIYHSRETVKGMMKQALGNGKWNIIVCKKSESKSGLSLRHMVPFTFVIANLILLALGFLSRIFWWAFLVMYVLYFGLAVYFAFKKTKNVWTVLRMCGYYWLLHMSYGWGSLVEFLNFRSISGYHG